MFHLTGTSGTREGGLRPKSPGSLVHPIKCVGFCMEVTMTDQNALLLGIEEDSVVARRETNGDNDGSDRNSDFV